MKKIILAALLTISAFASETEVRVGTTFGSGTLSLSADGYSIGSVSGDFSGLKIQFGTVIKENDSETFAYLGYESAIYTTEGSNYKDFSRSFLFGAEGTVGNKIKFVYGGEFGLGSYDVDGTSVSFSTFSAEPFIGLRYDFKNSFSVNSRLGYKVVRLLEEDYQGIMIDGTIRGTAMTVSVNYSFD